MFKMSYKLASWEVKQMVNKTISGISPIKKARNGKEYVTIFFDDATALNRWENGMPLKEWLQEFKIGFQVDVEIGEQNNFSYVEKMTPLVKSERVETEVITQQKPMPTTQNSPSSYQETQDERSRRIENLAVFKGLCNLFAGHKIGEVNLQGLIEMTHKVREGLLG